MEMDLLNSYYREERFHFLQWYFVLFCIFGIKYFSLPGHINKLWGMTKEHDFVGDLTKAGQDAATIKKLSNAPHGSMALSLSQIYQIIGDVRAGKGASDKWHLNPRKTKRMLDIIRAVREFIEADRHVTIRDIAEAGWLLHMDNCSSHMAKITKEFIAAKSIRLINHPPYSPNLAPADFVLFPKAKKNIAGIPIIGNTVKKGWEGVCHRLSTDDFINIFNKWGDHWNLGIKRETM